MNISRLLLIGAAIAVDATALSSSEGIGYSSPTTSTARLETARNLQNDSDKRAYYCACETCTQEIWESIAMDADGNCGSCTCGSRITYLQTTQGFDAAVACAKVSDEFIDGPCGPVCDPTKCEGGSTSLFLQNTSLAQKPTTTPPNIDPSNKPINIALGKVSTASSQVGSAAHAFDGNLKTRWESDDGIDDVWLQVDLGEMYQLSTVDIHWETASAKSYDIQVSTDGSSWTSVWSTIDGFEDMGLVESVFGVVTGRYVRMQAFERATEFGYSIWEMTVWVENPDSGTFAPSQSSPGISEPINIALGKVSTASSQFQSAAYAFDGSPTTRWESNHGIDDVWLQVDLGAIYQLSKVDISWETASAKSYDIQVSPDSSSWTSVWSTIDGFEDMGLVGSIFGVVTGRYVRMQASERATEFGYSIWEMKVLVENPDSGTFAPSQSSPGISEPINIALGKVATASSTEQSQLFAYDAANAFDGNPVSRWSSDHRIENVWLQVDLGATYQLNKVVVNWETANAKSYDIQVSTDGSTFSTVWSTTEGFQGMGTVESVFGVVNARYVRMQAYERATMWGYSIWEIEVFGRNPIINAMEPTINPTRDDSIAISEGQNEVNALVVVTLLISLLIMLLLVAVVISKTFNPAKTFNRVEQTPPEII